jgi:hypothetical protein
MIVVRISNAFFAALALAARLEMGEQQSGSQLDASAA